MSSYGVGILGPDTAPTDRILIGYDEQHLVTYLRLPDAEQTVPRGRTSPGACWTSILSMSRSAPRGWSIRRLLRAPASHVWQHSVPTTIRTGDDAAGLTAEHPLCERDGTQRRWTSWRAPSTGLVARLTTGVGPMGGAAVRRQVLGAAVDAGFVTAGRQWPPLWGLSHTTWRVTPSRKAAALTWLLDSSDSRCVQHLTGRAHRLPSIIDKQALTEGMVLPHRGREATVRRDPVRNNGCRGKSSVTPGRRRDRGGRTSTDRPT